MSRPDRAAPAAPLDPVSPAPGAMRATWGMLLVLTLGFALSQAYRTIAAIMAAPLQADFHVSAQALGVFAGAFHFAFGAMQLFMGIGIDLHGVRRTALTVFPLTVVGAAVSALATRYDVLVLGQALIGVGCAPAFLVCTVFIARRFPAERFAAVSGAILGIGSLGMLLTGTPLAWLIEASSWRAGFWVLGGCSVLAWLAIAAFVREPAGGVRPAGAQRETLGEAVARFARLFALPHTLGIVLLSLVTYASFIALRGLWLGPMLMQRHGYSLVESGNVALVMTAVALVGPPLFGRFDPGPATRRRWLVGLTLLVAALFAVLALNPNPMVDVTLTVVIGVLSGYMTLQYPDVKDAYPAHVTGRAMALFTMALFLGVALMQWLTGAIASAAKAHGVEPFMAVFGSIALLLTAGALAFAWLPGPPRPAAGGLSPAASGTGG